MESELAAGWVEVASHRAAEGAPEDAGIMQVQSRQWLDLLASRGARVSIGRHGCRGGLHPAGPFRAVTPNVDPSGVRLSLERPAVEFGHPEAALLSGGADSVELARWVAQRVAWCEPFVGSRGAAGVGVGVGAVVAAAAEVERSTAAPSSVHWRGRTWRLRALDGWERIAAPWWSCADVHGGAHEGHVEAGRLYGRLCIGGGLWIFVRWPETLRCRGASGQPPPHTADRTDGQSGQPWIVRGAQAIRRGVELEVLGAWG